MPQTIRSLPPQDDTAWYGHYTDLDLATREVQKAVRYARASRTAGNVNVANTSFATFDTALNLTLAAASGSLLEVLLITQASTSASSSNGSEIDFAVQILNNGTAVRGLIGTATSVISSWSARGGDYTPGGGTAGTILTSADIYQGTVTVQLMVKTSVAISPARQLFANTDNPTVFSAKTTLLG